ncbi:MAG TPA: hypothetical protein VGL77_16375 [Armatimonadota bacterium]|jgi:hypothetical protein
MNLVAQIAPQRSTQYAALADALAAHELELSPLGKDIAPIERVVLGGQAYLRFDYNGALDGAQCRELGMLAMTSAYFEFREQFDEASGPWLRPIEAGYQPAFPPDLIMTRRYKGKTNELFTQFLCNIARHSSEFANEPWQNLRLFDPLAGGGTTMFAALLLGANVAGVEKVSGDVESTATFIEQYMREQGIPCRMKEERLKKIGRRWWFALGKGSADAAPQQCVIAIGETAHSADLLSSVKKPHLIVTDLPYGIQHRGELTGLLDEALPVWESLLLPGGALAMSWDATRFTRAEMVTQVRASVPLIILDEPPYNQLAHRVDRVIKQRDVLVARKPMADAPALP